MAVSNHQIEYNSGREDIIIPEYGRHVQKLIEHCKTIEDKEKRQQFAEGIINLMEQMNPQNKNILEYRMRLWRHLIRIAGYDIDVTPIDGVSTTKPEKKEATVHLAYPQSEFRFKHYGNTIQKMIAKAANIDDEVIRNEFLELILGYMKLAYVTWHKDHVSDEVIKNDLKKLSKGKLEAPEGISIPNFAPIQRKSSSSSSKGKGSKGGSKMKKRKRVRR